MSKNSNVPVVPPRKAVDFSRELIRGDAGLDDSKAKPGFVRRWFSTDPNIGLESQVDYRNESHLYGDDEVGRIRIPAWQAVKKDDVKDQHGRDDVGTGIDTTLRRGKLVCMELPVEEYERYQYIKAQQKIARNRRLAGGTHNAPTAGASAVSGVAIARGNEPAADHRSVIRE